MGAVCTAQCAHDVARGERVEGSPLATVCVPLLFHTLGLSMALVVTVCTMSARRARIVLGATSENGASRCFAFRKVERGVAMAMGQRRLWRMDCGERGVFSINKFCIVIGKGGRTTVESLLCILEMDLALCPLFAPIGPFSQAFNVVHTTKDLFQLRQKRMASGIIGQSGAQT